MQLGEWIQQGKIKVAIDSVFEYEQPVEAFKKLRSGRARGKIIVHVSEPWSPANADYRFSMYLVSFIIILSNA